MFSADNSGSHRRYDRKRIKRSHTDEETGLLDPGILLIAAGLVTAFTLLLLSFLFPGPAGAVPLQQSETYTKPSEVHEGSLLFKNVQTGQYMPAPQLSTDVQIDIFGMVAYVRVIQEFHNPGDQWLEGVYVFPLPEKAAVNRLLMDVGDRVIEGVIKERQEAKKIYHQARKEGKKASLLEPEDRFNIITFNSITDKLYSDAKPGTDHYIDKALDYVDNLKADGGTEIEPAILAALDDRTNLDRIRQVVFLTDGCVGNEQALFKAVRKRLGDSRVFTIGIGSAPNSYFMRNIAERGHGTFTYIGNINEVRDRMEELFKKLEK